MTTVEEAVDFLLYTPATKKLVSLVDYTTLHEIRGKTWYNNQAITTRQQTLVQSILGKYLLLLQTAGWPVQDLYEPLWQTPTKQIAYVTNWTIHLDRALDKWILQFPYDRNLAIRLHQVHDMERMFDTVKWNPDNRYWTVDNGFQGKRLICGLLRENSKWICSLTDRKSLETVGFRHPTVTYANGRWQYENAPATLAPHLDRIISQELSPLETAKAMGVYSVDFDFRAQRYISNWCSSTQASILCDRNPVIDYDRIHEIYDLADKLNQWPLFLTENHWYDDHEQRVRNLQAEKPQLNILDLAKYYTPTSEVILEFAAKPGPKVIYSAGLNTETIALFHQTLTTVPWLVAIRGLVDQYSPLKFGADHVFDKLITVNKET